MSFFECSSISGDDEIGEVDVEFLRRLYDFV